MTSLTQPMTASGAARWRSAAWALAALLPILAYLPALAGGFLFDDHPLIEGNLAIQNPGEWTRYFTGDIDAVLHNADRVQSNYYRPLMLLALAAIWQAVGSSAAGWHAAVLLLHGLAGLLAMKALRAQGLPLGAALAGSLLFSLHPGKVHSVAWVAGIQDVLGGVATLVAFLLWRRAVDSGATRWLASAAFAFAAALLFKESAFGLLLYLAGERIWAAWRALPEPGLRRRSRAIFAFGGVAVAYLAARWAVLGALARPFPGSSRSSWIWLDVPRVVLIYLRDLLYPVDLSLLHPARPAGRDDPALWLGVAGLVALVLLAMRWIQRRPDAALPLLWFAAFLAPHLGLRALNPEWLVMTRYLYVGSLGLGWALVDPRCGLAAPRLRWAATGIVLVAFVALTEIRIPVYRNEATFWNDALLHDPGSSTAWVETARLASDAGRLEDASQKLEHAQELDPNSLLIWIRRGRLALARGQAGEAVAFFRGAAERNPDYLPAWINLPSALQAAGQPEEALRAAAEGAKRFPRAVEVQENLGVLLRASGRRDEAVELFRRLRSIAPPPSRSRMALREALLLVELGRNAEAAEAARAGLALDPPEATRVELARLAAQLERGGP